MCHPTVLSSDSKYGVEYLVSLQSRGTCSSIALIFHTGSKASDLKHGIVAEDTKFMVPLRTLRNSAPTMHGSPANHLSMPYPSFYRELRVTLEQRDKEKA